MSAIKKLHWTQRPENKDKVLAMAAKGGKTKLVKSPKPRISFSPLIAKYQELRKDVTKRLDEIEKEMNLLVDEKDKLLNLFINEGEDNGNA